jgi:hypothetical protein
VKKADGECQNFGHFSGTASRESPTQPTGDALRLLIEKYWQHANEPILSPIEGYFPRSVAKPLSHNADGLWSSGVMHMHGVAVKN